MTTTRAADFIAPDASSLALISGPMPVMSPSIRPMVGSVLMGLLQITYVRDNFHHPTILLVEGERNHHFARRRGRVPVCNSFIRSRMFLSFSFPNTSSITCSACAFGSLPHAAHSRHLF